MEIDYDPENLPQEYLKGSALDHYGEDQWTDEQLLDAWAQAYDLTLAQIQGWKHHVQRRIIETMRRKIHHDGHLIRIQMTLGLNLEPGNGELIRRRVEHLIETLYPAGRGDDRARFEKEFADESLALLEKREAQVREHLEGAASDAASLILPPEKQIVLPPGASRG